MGKTAPEDMPLSQELADTISSLPGVVIVDRRGDTLPCQASAYLHEHPDRRTLGNPRSVLLCRIDIDGITINGLNNWEKHQVVMRGWGKLRGGRVLLHLPRDDGEFETCCSIIQQAYEALADPSANTGRRSNASAWEMPKYSRTTLQ